MKIISKVERKNIVVDEDTSIAGILVGNADVHEEAVLHIGGIMNGNVKVREKASLSVTGILNGDVIDDGGEIQITGIHNGKVV